MKISVKKLQLAFFLTFGAFAACLICLVLEYQIAGIAFLLVTMIGYTMMLMAGQCPNCRDVRSAKWVNPFSTGKKLYCKRCGKQMEFEQDGWFRLRNQKESDKEI